MHPSQLRPRLFDLDLVRLAVGDDMIDVGPAFHDR